MAKVKVALVGAGGRMGKAIVQVLAQSQKSELVAALVKEGSVYVGFDSGIHSGLKENSIVFDSNLEEKCKLADVIIDFSSHAVFKENLEMALKTRKPLVIGTTGLTAEDKASIRKASETIPIVFSPNMSIGVNLLFKLSEIAAKVLGNDFDIEILDIHHKHKKDSPSGTAQRIKEVLLKALDRNESQVVYGRHGMYPERPKTEIALHTLRGGEVIGDHTVYFLGGEERIEISHKAQDRKTFAVGAVRAGEFLSNQTKGLYDMFDVLGI